jgi:glycerophosphoryl diester phosphodiesterase
MSQRQVEIHGHRGTRGYLPENTIPSFIKAIELGATAIELDVVISKDGLVVVSHEPYMSANICLDSLGKPLKNSAKNHNIYEMTYAQVACYDCGSLKHNRFPEQENFKVEKPLLSDVIDTLEQYVKAQGIPAIKYNVEVKSDPKGDRIHHPEPPRYVEILVELLRSKNVNDHLIVQSFDERILQEFHRQAPEITISFLVANLKSFSANIESLGFLPTYYTPYFKLLNRKKVKEILEAGVKVGVWTVNKPKDIKHMINIGVDAIISDYPDRVIELLSN